MVVNTRIIIKTLLILFLLIIPLVIAQEGVKIVGDDFFLFQIINTSLVDTNATTACDDGEYLDGSGSCINFNSTVALVINDSTNGTFLRLDASNQGGWIPTVTLINNLNADFWDGKDGVGDIRFQDMLDVNTAGRADEDFIQYDSGTNTHI